MKNEFDHRVLGDKYNLFSFFEEGPGFPVWHEKGLAIKNSLIDFWRKVHRKNGYSEIESPMMLDRSLWEKSGHCDYFAENMYFSEVDKRDYVIKPMNCPAGILYFKQKRRSHAELPLRICELGHVHRHEFSGSLHGLLRVRSFVQDDAHIFCKKRELHQEVLEVIKLFEFFMKECGLKDYHFELSLRGGGKKYLGSEEDWKEAELVLENALIGLGHAVRKKYGEAKFYGPSLDLHLKDVHGRQWQCSSLQLDFNLPRLFDLHYFDEQGLKQRPLMLHRAIYGSLERFIAILLENYGRNLPFWLQPVQFKVLNVDSFSLEYAQNIKSRLERQQVRVESDFSGSNLGEKIRKCRSEFVDNILIVGADEKQASSLIWRQFSRKSQSNISLVDFFNRYQTLII